MYSNNFFLLVLNEFIFQIPNGEVTSEWHEWVVGYLNANRVTSLSGMHDTIMGMPKVSKGSLPPSYRSTLHTASQGEGLSGAFVICLFSPYSTIW
jgi:hypothetical protein